LKIVGNEARRRQASSIRQRNLAEHVAAAPMAGSRSVESEVLNSELRGQLHRAIESLSETDRLVIAYRFVLELSEKEMAAAMNCRPGTVKSRLSRALTRLKERLASFEPDFAAAGVADA
jgi:RNA polymerase sigma-70 factor (ECF subfamily)